MLKHVIADGFIPAWGLGLGMIAFAQADLEKVIELVRCGGVFDGGFGKKGLR